MNPLRIVKDASEGRIDEAYLDRLDPQYRAFATSLRNLFDCVSDQVTAMVTPEQNTSPIWDETEERYI